MSEPEKYYHKLPPCALHDTLAMQSWLEELSEQGLELQPENPFFGFLSFIPCPPRKVRYRMEPALKRQGFFSNDPGDPTEEAQGLYEALGWKFVLRLGEFFLYRCFDPQAPELMTDPRLQEACLKQLGKRQKSALMALLLNLGLQVAFGALGYPAMLLVALGTGTTACLAAVLLIALVQPLFLLIHLGKLRHSLLSGNSASPQADWRRKRLRHFAALALSWLLSILLCIGFLTALYKQENAVPLKEYTGEVPFVTMVELIPGGSFEPASYSWSNEVTVWEDILIRETMEYRESGTVTAPDGTVWTGSLAVKYHETAFPFLAEQLMREYLRYADRGKYYDGYCAPDFDTGPVTVRLYQGHYGLNTLVMQYGNKVLEVNVLIHDREDRSAADLWIRAMVSRLLS